MIKCKNCFHSSSGKYCPKCGQIMKTERITLKHLLLELIHMLTHVDKGFLYSLKQLALHPGTMQKKYLEGFRTQHQKPFSMFFICGTVTAFALYLIHKPSGEIASHFQEVQGHFTRHYYVLVQLALLPVYSFITWLLFRNNKINYAETLVFFTYALSFMLLVVILTNLVDLFPNNVPSSYYEIPILFGYLLWTNLNFFTEEAKWRVIFKSILNIFIGYYISRYSGDLIVQLLL